jgi:peptidoglycan/LPS O-acetylase OafA/YrhL
MGDAPQRRRFDSLQAGRGLAALMVVLCHIGSFVGKEPGLWGREIVFRWLGPGKYGVDFFFILSGVVIFLAHWTELGNPAKIPSFLWKRFRRIYPIYWVFLVPTILKQFKVVDNDTIHHHHDKFVILSSFLLVHIHSIGYNMMPSWTLFHEVLFYLFFCVLLLRKELGAVLFFLWFAASFFFFSPQAVSADPATYLQVLFSPLHLLFGFGMLVGWILHNRRAPAQLWLLVSGLGIFFGALVFDALNPPGSAWVRILGGAGLALAVLTGAERESLQKLHVPRALVFLGDASYSIYLVHFMVVSAIARKGFALDHRLHLPLAVWMTLMFVAAVALGILAHLIIERPLLRWLSGLSRKPSPAAVEPQSQPLSALK